MVALTADDRRILEEAPESASALAMRMVVGAARMLGAARLVPIVSAHIDGCLYHGDAGVTFAEMLVSRGGRVAVPATLNVGALDLVHHGRVKLDAHASSMAARLMEAYGALGCTRTWTCAPYQAGHRPGLGEHAAWGESNAVVFCNSVLGARTARYGDFLDICCAIAGRAPEHGLHIDACRQPAAIVNLHHLPPSFLKEEVAYPILGAWLGQRYGDAVVAFRGGMRDATEDDLKALGAAAASRGAIGLFHIIGRTPEAPDLETLLGGRPMPPTVWPSLGELRDTARQLSDIALQPGAAIDAIALGSPHFSEAEAEALLRLAAGRRFALPVYVCTGRHTIAALERSGTLAALRKSGAIIVADTCVVVTPILPQADGVLMTNSGKFAHYGKSMVGHDVVFGSLADCVETAVSGRLVQSALTWN